MIKREPAWQAFGAALNKARFYESVLPEHESLAHEPETGLLKYSARIEIKPEEVKLDGLRRSLLSERPNVYLTRLLKDSLERIRAYFREKNISIEIEEGKPVIAHPLDFETAHQHFGLTARFSPSEAKEIIARLVHRKTIALKEKTRGLHHYKFR